MGLYVNYERAAKSLKKITCVLQRTLTGSTLLLVAVLAEYSDNNAIRR